MTLADLAQLRASMAALQHRVERLETETAVRGVVAEYMRLCDLLDGSIAIDDLGALFTRDAVWEGRGALNAAVFGRHVGRQAIMAFLDTYQSPVPHFALNVHFLTSETISVQDCDTRGSWVMLQTSTLSDGSSTLTGVRLHLGFAFEEGRWRIAHFQTTNLFSRSIVHPWNQATTIRTPAALK